MASGRGRVGGVAAKEVAMVKTVAVVVVKTEVRTELVALVETETSGSGFGRSGNRVSGGLWQF